MDDISLIQYHLFPACSQVFFELTDSQSLHSIDSTHKEESNLTEFALLESFLLSLFCLHQHKVSK